MTAAKITVYLHEKIPITKAMGVVVESSGEEGLAIRAPLALNHNHLGTAFGGSLSAIATLAGYVFIWVMLKDEKAHVVVRDGTSHFRRPVRGDIRAVCHAPDAETMRAFYDDYARNGRARLKLRTEIEDGGSVAVEFEGTFVAQS